MEQAPSGVTFQNAGCQNRRMKRLPPGKLRTLREQKQAAVVDVRSREEFDAGHVQGARHIPLDELPTRVNELPRDRPVVTYCNMFYPGPSRGEKAAAQLAELGFDAAVLQGGLSRMAGREHDRRGAGGSGEPLRN